MHKVGKDHLTAIDDALEEGMDATRLPLPMKIWDVKEEGAMTGLRPPLPKMLAGGRDELRGEKREEVSGWSE